ncbi:MAG: GNAT family N-acetyltransferase [Prevotellaceae bacterium]|jgi:predicted acetyltransferase|nr:GNAT family N-acetyltransferase [Prevotellaceae bacterium]
MNDVDINIDMAKQMKLKELSKALYKLCFDDSDKFADFYFDKRYTEKNHFAIFENNNPVAALQAIPYMMTFFDEKIDLAYLSAICTHPNFRRQGLMTKLLEKTYRQLFADGIYAAFLIPADSYLFDIYGKNDYETIFYRTKTQINTRNFNIKNDCKIYEYSEANKHETFKYFDRKMSERNFCIQHSFSDFEIVCEDIYNSSGLILIAEYGNKIAGISFVSLVNSNITVNEHFADTREISASLLKTISEKTAADSLTYIDIPQKKHCEAIGMMRIICVEKILQLYAKKYRNCHTAVFVKDSVIAENSGCYRISNGECIKLPFENSHEAWKIAQLTQFVFDGQTPYMSLMLNE